MDFSEEDSHTKLAEADLITKNDSDEDESDGSTDESAQDNMVEGRTSSVLDSLSRADITADAEAIQCCLTPGLSLGHLFRQRIFFPA